MLFAFSFPLHFLYFIFPLVRQYFSGWEHFPKLKDIGYFFNYYFIFQLQLMFSITLY